MLKLKLWQSEWNTNGGDFSDVFHNVSKCASCVAAVTLISCKFIYLCGQVTCNYARPFSLTCLYVKGLRESPERGKRFSYYLGSFGRYLCDFSALRSQRRHNQQQQQSDQTVSCWNVQTWSFWWRRGQWWTVCCLCATLTALHSGYWTDIHTCIYIFQLERKYFWLKFDSHLTEM